MQFHACALLLAALTASMPVFSADPIADFRRDLANNEKFPLRRGNTVDLGELQKAVLSTRTANAAMLQKQYDESYKSLAAKPSPDEKKYELIFENRDFAHLKDNLSVYGTFFPDVKRLTQMILTSVMPMSLSRDLGFNMTQVGAWIAFLGMAEPEWYACGTDAAYATICLSYGDLDIFKIVLKVENGAADLLQVSWYRRKGIKPNAR
jgi:hypothetical protein